MKREKRSKVVFGNEMKIPKMRGEESFKPLFLLLQVTPKRASRQVLEPEFKKKGK